MSAITRLKLLFWDSLGPLKAVTVPMYLFEGIGIFVKRASEDPDMHLIYHSLPWWDWCLLAAYCTVARLVGVLYWDGTRATRLATPIFGMAIWSFLLAASMKSPKDFGMALLYIVALGLEFWVLLRAFFEKKATAK